MISLKCNFRQTSEELEEMPHLSKCDQGWAIQRKGESWKSRSDWGGNKVKQVNVIYNMEEEMDDKEIPVHWKHEG